MRARDAIYALLTAQSRPAHQIAAAPQRQGKQIAVGHVDGMALIADMMNDIANATDTVGTPFGTEQAATGQDDIILLWFVAMFLIEYRLQSDADRNAQAVALKQTVWRK